MIILITIFIFKGEQNFKSLKSLLSAEQKDTIKKYVFPYKIISQQNDKINEYKEEIDLLKSTLITIELDYIESLGDIETTKSTVKLSNNKILKKFKLNSGFVSGTHELYPGTGYIDFYENNMFIISARGNLSFSKNFSTDELSFKQIKNNISDFLTIEQFKKDRRFSIKDLMIFNKKIFVSYTQEIKEDCWNTGIINGDINFENIFFKKLFQSEDCINSINNPEGFGGFQQGGRIVSLNDNHILFSIGDYGNRHLPQDIKSVNGKLIKINTDDGNFQIVSIGHRNPQGLYFDKDNNFIIETEHGPFGGDEVNIIEVSDINKDIIQNYGWPISSYGEHYGGNVKKNFEKYKKYPLYKSHKDHGFIEPIKAFVPSIAISEIVKIRENEYVLSSMGKDRDGDKSLYFFKLNNKKKIVNLEQVKVFERIRDLSFRNNNLYLFMENSASIGILNLDTN
tara:strand:+ start:1645 stop:3003 length:1359 start_codon:yes stop_codon:yes gene_type:complete